MISNSEHIEQLSTLRLFKELNKEALNRVAENLTLQHFPKGTSPYDSNKTLNHFYIVLSGRLKVYQVNPENGRNYTFYILSNGDAFDLLTLLDGQEHDIMTKTLEDMTVFSAPIEKARNWIKEIPEFNQAFFPYVAKRMRMLEEATTDIVLIDTCTRLARLILKNFNSSTHELNLINNLSHDEIANMIGTTRAVVNRHLQELKKEGILNIKRKQLYVKDLTILKQKCQDL